MRFISSSARASALVLSSYVFVFFITLCIISCKRDLKNTTEPKTQVSNMPKALSDLIKEKGRSFRIEINRQTPAILVDKNGNEIATKPSGTSRLLQTPDEICEDPGSAELNTALLWVENTVDNCVNQTHTITARWRVTSSFDLAIANPGPSYQASRGRLRIKNGATITYPATNVNLTSGDLVYIGLSGGLKVYEITYSKTGIPHSYLAQGQWTALEVALSVYSDCGDPFEPYVIVTSFTQAFAPQVGLDVCERNDLVYINPSTVLNPPPSSDQCGYIGGSWATNSPGACQNYNANLGSHVQVKRSGDPDINYTNLQVKAAGDPSWRTNGYVFNWEVLLMRELQAYVPNPPGSFPASYTFRWKNFDGSFSPLNVSCFTPYWYTPQVLSVYDF